MPGVTSISADLHKYGYATKGISVILYRQRELARLQPFITSNWLGGLYGSPSMAGTRPAGPIAAGWAVLHHLGTDGYRRLAEDTHQAAALTSPPSPPPRGWPCGAGRTPPCSPSAATPTPARWTPSPWATPWPTGEGGSSTGRARRTASTPPCTLDTGRWPTSSAPTCRVAGELLASGARTLDRSATYGTA